MSGMSSTTCPRCASPLRSGSARFCVRCGAALPGVDVAMRSRHMPASQPPIPPPTMRSADARPQNMPALPMSRAKNRPAAPQYFFWGLILALLAIAGIVLLVGTFSLRSKSYPATVIAPPNFEPVGGLMLYARPRTAFDASQSRRAQDGQINSAFVESAIPAATASDLVISAMVRPSSGSRLLLVAYVLDVWNQPVMGQSEFYRDQDGSLAVGKYIESDGYKSRSSDNRTLTQVRLSIPGGLLVPVSLTSPTGQVQLSLFDERGVEIARRTLVIPRGRW